MREGTLGARRLLGAVPWVLLAAGLGLAGWIGWDTWQSVREANQEAAIETATTTLPTPTSTSPMTTTTLVASTTSAPTTTALVTTTTSSALPAGWEESCELAVAALTDQGYAAMQRVGSLTVAIEKAEALAGTWRQVADMAEDWVVPGVETLVRSAEEVIAADADTVSTIAAEAFTAAGSPLIAHARELVASVIDYPGSRVDPAVWDAWWAEWSRQVQGLNDVLSRSPQMAYNCPD